MAYDVRVTKEIISQWNSRHFDSTFVSDSWTLSRTIPFLYCYRCGTYCSEVASYTPHSGNTPYTIYVCKRCSDLYNPQTKKFPKVGELEVSWVLMLNRGNN